MNSDQNIRWESGESSVVRTLDDDEAIRKSVYSRARNSSFLKIRQLVLVQIADACRLGALMFFIFGLVSVGTICVAIGIFSVHHCPLQKYIPIYLIAEGVLMLMALPHVVLANGNRPERYADFISFLYKAVLCSFEICILVLGTVVTYSVLPPNFDPSKGPHCSKVCFLAAFSLVTITWCFILMLIMFGSLMICFNLFHNSNPGENPRPPPP